MTARDIMTTDIFMLQESQLITDAAHLFLEKNIGGAPVTSEDGRLVGILTKTDISGFVFGRQLQMLLEVDVGDILADSEAKNAFHVEMSGDKIQDIMTPDPVSAAPDTPVETLAVTMLDRSIHRIIIMEDEKIVGVVSAMDILKYFMPSE